MILLGVNACSEKGQRVERKNMYRESRLWRRGILSGPPLSCAASEGDLRQFLILMGCGVLVRFLSPDSLTNDNNFQLLFLP